MSTALRIRINLPLALRMIKIFKNYLPRGRHLDFKQWMAKTSTVNTVVLQELQNPPEDGLIKVKNL